MHSSLQNGLAKGWRGFRWMLKIILPVSLATFLLDYSGLLGHMDTLLAPLMGLIHLPAVATLPLMAGLLTGIYGGIAAMSVLPLTIDQMTLIAVFLLIAHNLVQEGMVQRASGCPAWMATTVRLTAAVLTVFVVGWLLDPQAAPGAAKGPTDATQMMFWPALGNWAVAMAGLSLKILLIIMIVMTGMAFLNQYRLVDKLVKTIEPVLVLLGLDKQMGMLWITAAVFGIAYGGAVIVEETRKRRLPAEKLKSLHVSIGINHAMVEDPSLFLPLGIHPLWLWIPRLIIAVAFTYAYRLWIWAKTRRRLVVVNRMPVDGR